MKDDGLIDLRKEKPAAQEEGPEFRLDRKPEFYEEDTAPVSELEMAAMKPYDKVKVKFDKFVNLVVNHAYEDIFEQHREDDVIISTDLLADLANSHEEKKEKNSLPVILLVGMLIGVGLAWLIFRT